MGVAQEKPEEENTEPRELLDLDVREVSLVDRPAIKRKFLVVKQDELNQEDTDMQQDEFLEVDSEQAEFFFYDDSEQDQSVIKANISEEIKKMVSPQLAKLLAGAIEGLTAAGEDYEGAERTKLTNAAKVLEGVLESKKDDTSEDETKDEAETKADTKAENEDEPEEEESEEEEEEEESEEKQKSGIKKKNKKTKETLKMANPTSIPVSFSKREDGTYNLAGVPKEMQATVEEICKQHDAAIQKAAELEEVLKAERDERLRRDYVEKAGKEFSNLPGTSAEVGILLKSLNDLDKGVAEKVESIFKAVNGQLESSALLQEVGSHASDVDSTAWGRIEKQAAEMMVSGEISKATAVSKVLEMNPKLYQDYLKEGGN